MKTAPHNLVVLAISLVATAMMTIFLSGSIDWQTPLAWLVLGIPLLAFVLPFVFPETPSPSMASRISSSTSLFIPAALTCGLLIVFISSAAANQRFYIVNWWPSAFSAGALVKSGVVQFFAATVVFLFVLPLLRARGLTRLLWITVTFAIAASMYALIAKTGGAALYRDDHPSFMFRFWAFAQSVPSLSYYNPFWNGGRIETAAISTGVQIPGLLFWPFWRFFPVHEVYTFISAVILALVIPCLAVAGVRLAGGGGIAMAIAALLALNPGRFIFIWTLHFGTIPSGMASAFIMLVGGALVGIFRSEQPSRLLIAALAAGLVGMATWPPGALMAIPAGLAALFCARDWTKVRLHILVIAVLIVGCLTLPGVWSVFQHVHVDRFVTAETRAMAWGAEIIKGGARILTHLRGSNLLIVFFGVLGVWFIPAGPLRRIGGVMIAGLMLMAGWGLMFKPVLQLNRAAIPLMFVAIIPASIWLESILPRREIMWAPFRAALLAALIIGTTSAPLVYANQGPAPYTVLNDDVEQMVDWIQASTPEDSRVLFAGPTVHAYGGGHVAYLPVMAGRAMMACDYYHFSPKLVEYDYPPKSFRRDDEATLRFFDLYNVSAVMTYHPTWLEFFRRHPDRFTEAGVFGPSKKRIGFTLVRPAPGWFYEGAGRIEQGVNRLDIHVEDPSRPVVIRFDWVNGLRPDKPVVLEPVEVEPGVRFIKIHPQGHASFSLTWSQWQRGVVADTVATEAIGGRMIGGGDDH